MIPIRGFVNRHRALLLIWLIYMSLGVIYNMSLPLFEAPDEFNHFRFIHWLSKERRLPDMVEDLATVGHEIWQPPLYYAVVAPFVARIDMSDLYSVSPVNEYWVRGAGINVHFHTEAERFPYQKTSFAVHLARFLSTLIGSLAIVSAYGLAKLVAPGTAVLAASLVAFNPQFLFISAAVSNDALVAALGGWALWFLVWLLFQPTLRLWHFTLLGLLWGLLALAKLSGLLFGVVILVGLALIAWRRRIWTPLLLGAPIALATGVLTAGWWFWRNWRNYGDPLAWNEMLKPIAPLVRTNSISWLETFEYAAFLRKSYWAMFGYGIRAPEMFYWVALSIMLLAGAGLLLWFWQNGSQQWQQPQTHAALLLIIWSSTIFVSLLRWMRLLTATNQGRLLFPALVSLAVLMAVGIKTIIGREKWPQYVIVCVLAMWATAFPWLTIQPAYAHPEPLSEMAVLPNPLSVRLGQEIQLVGFDLVTPIVKPGETVTVDFYWGALQPIKENYQVRLRLLDAEWRMVTEIATVPYQGRYTTLLWRPGEIFLDRYILPVVADDAVPGQGRLVVSLHPWDNLGNPLPVIVDDIAVGHDLTIAPLKIAPTESLIYQPERTVNTTFGSQAKLLGYDISETVIPGVPLRITLYWEAIEPDGRDYTVFLHLIDEEGQLVSQVDGLPQEGRYPSSIWASGEQIEDIRKMHLPANLSPGNYRLFVGLYDLATEQRLTAVSDEGIPWIDNSVELTFISISHP